MSHTDAGQSTDEEPLKKIFDDAMKIYEQIEKSNEPTNSNSVQLSIKAAIAKFEKATNLVSLSGMFSKNESIEELPTETLQYLLLPALLGTLSLKLCNQSRLNLVNVAEIYFRDFLQRCKDYGMTDQELPQTNGQTDSTMERVQTEQAKIASMIQTRESKIKRYKEQQQLKEQVASLSKAMELHTDEDIKRQYFTKLLLSYINQAFDELASIEQEKTILEYMAKNAGEPKPKERNRTPLKPVIITRDVIQKAVFGAGYPAIPTLTVEEFYDQRVREGIFPGGCADNIPHRTIQNTEEDADEAERIRREQLVEQDDPEELARQRNMDEFKDEHRRGSGNRYNRS